MLVRVLLANALSPIESTLFGIVSVVKLLFKKALFPIAVILV